MEISNKLKDFIFKKLYEELSNVEIIPYNNSIWFIDRENKYWYFEYEKNGTLWWRNSFFDNFFVWFSVERNDFELIISEWVEEVLNCKVNAPFHGNIVHHFLVEEVLNCKVNAPFVYYDIDDTVVEEVLNCDVTKKPTQRFVPKQKIEEILNG